jgi:hypothetical protein
LHFVNFSIYERQNKRALITHKMNAKTIKLWISINSYQNYKYFQEGEKHLFPLRQTKQGLDFTHDTEQMSILGDFARWFLVFSSQTDKKQLLGTSKYNLSLYQGKIKWMNKSHANWYFSASERDNYCRFSVFSLKKTEN